MEDTLLDLQARKVELVDGLAVLNDRAIPFDLAAKDVDAAVRYCGGRISMARRSTSRICRRRLRRSRRCGRRCIDSGARADRMALTKLEFWSGAEAGTGSAHLVAQASLQNFAHPQWQGSASGSVGLRQLSYLADVNGLVAGTIDVNLHGHNCVAQPTVAPKPRRFWQRRGKKPAPAAAATRAMRGASRNLRAGVRVAGSMKMHEVGYRDVNVRVRDVDGSALLHMTPEELRFSEVSAFLPGGGAARGELKIEDWLGSAPAAAAATSVQPAWRPRRRRIPGAEYRGEEAGETAGIRAAGGEGFACVPDGDGRSYSTAHGDGYCGGRELS